jgi:hypothetical protein
MERSVQRIVAGGLALVAGLWLLAAREWVGQWRYGGAAIALVGIVLLGAGIDQDLTAWPFSG